ncbi:MAG: hypothetical protein A2W81_06080 [Betaproteobacteria bacterium RIFCSPLOWO2_12_61_14]|nr:MAG: hypothetical protein A2W81_06080 [Betaproteobacteria bacterium RIFCSPLOWO2_12_61_14]
MTGYAALSREIGQALLAVELKSVNSRFLDLQFRLPEELRSAEPALRELLAARVTRGKVECRMAIQPSAGTALQLAVNEVLLAALAQAERKVLDALPGAQPLRVGEVLHWPGMLANEEAGAEALREASVALVKTALAEFAATRAREGEKLKDMILERIDRKLRRDIGALASGANLLGVGALSQRQRQRVDEYRLARPGLAGERREPRTEDEFQGIDDREIAYRELNQHGSPTCLAD